MRRIATCKLLCACATLFALAAPSPGDEKPENLDALVHQLADADWSIRQRAEDGIVALGTSAIESVQTALEGTTDVEVRERLRSALRRIGRDELMGPTLVTLDRTFARPTDAFDELARAVGISLDYENDAARAMVGIERPFTFAIKNEPWLLALSRVSTETGINVRVDDGRLVVLERPLARTATPTMHVAGAIALRIDNSRQRKTLDLATDVTSANTSLSFSVILEPKLRIRGTATMILGKLRDDIQRDLVDPRNRRFQMGRTLSTLLNGTIAMQPQPGATKIDLFEGDVLMEVITRTETVRVADLNSLPTTISCVGGDIIVDTLVKTNDGWELQMRLPYSSRTAAPNVGVRDTGEVMRVLTNDSLKVFDQGAKPIRVGPPEMVGVDNGLMARVPLPADADARPTSIEWTLPTQSRQIRQPFKLGDLPLP